MKKSRAAAFTLVEMMVSACVAVLLSGIIYTIGSEALVSFSRNMSLNRCYSDARNALDRMSALAQSAGHTPVLINEDGSYWAASSLASTPAMTANRAAGIRFYCYDTLPSYDITTCATNTETMTITVPSGDVPPRVGDLVTVNAVGFQGLVLTVSGTTSVKMTFTDMNDGGSSSGGLLISALCSSNSSSITDLSSYYCLVYNQVAFIAVSTPALTNPAAAPTSSNIVAATSTELRYYSDANVMTKYKVISRLTLNQNDPQEVFIKRPRPFQVLASPTVTATLCVQAPDYTNRIRDISDANTFTRVQTSFGPRNPLLLNGPF